jgi:hypothetical protein
MVGVSASIVDALEDPHLFGSFFEGETWDAWRVFLRGLFALPLIDDDLAFFTKYTGRTVAPTKPFREAALICGRRSGKTRIISTIAVYLSFIRDYRRYLAPGQIATIGILASDRKQAREAFNFCSGLFRYVPSLTGLVEREDGERIVLNNQVQIEIGTASFRSTRGYTYIAVIADEVAYWRDETSANPDIEILRAIRPGLINIPGSLLIIASSPYGKKGALYESFRRNYGDDAARVLVWKAPTLVMHENANHDGAITAAFEEDPEAARAEYGAEFRDDLADYITREIVDAITMWGRSEIPADKGLRYQAFVDPSGGVSDSMTMAIGHLEGDICVLDHLTEIRPPFDPDAAVAQCAATLREYGVSKVIGDHYAGLWPVGRFQTHGITFEQSARPKSDIYGDFLPLANAKRVELLDNRRLASQFVSLERRTGRSGKDSIAEPKSLHDDLCNAVAGVIVLIDQDRRPTRFSIANLPVAGRDPFPNPPKRTAEEMIEWFLR